MRRSAAVVLAAVLSAVAISACGGSSGSSSVGSSTSGGSSHQSGPAGYDGKPVTISFWNPFTGRQLAVMNGVIAAFHKQYPNITVKSRGGITDDNIVAAIRGGSPPDLTMSQSSDNLGEYCGTGAWINLAPYIARDHVDLGVMPTAVRSYTQFNGDRCALPDLADAYGLYYNKAMFAKAGISSPPKTFAELTQDAEKLTQFNPDGSIKVAGFVPTSSFYENAAAHYAPLWNAQWDENGKSSLATDPHWAAYMRWEKGLIDFYGQSKLTRFLAKAGNEFSSSNDFETGRIAMELDGEWRVQFIKSDKATISYGTAPAPVDPSQPNLYGAGYTTGNVMGIPKGASNPAAAWLLAKYLAFNTQAIDTFADGLGNVPTITSALSYKPLVSNAPFDTFLKIFANPNTATDPITAIGSANQEMEQNFQTKWEDGSVPASEPCLRAQERRLADRRAGGQLDRRVGRSVSGAPAAALPPLSARRRAAKRSAAWRRRRTVLLFMSPWIVGFGVFFAYPLIDTAYLSLNHYDLLSPPRWVGLRNYSYLFNGDQEVWPAVSNTLWFLAIAVPLQVLFAFGIALMVSRARAGVGVFRTIFYLPTLAPSVAATLGFVFLFNPGTGPVNTLLAKIGITGPLWFQSAHWAKPSLTLLSLWGVGNAMVIFLAAILDVPAHLQEAAELDGAGALRRLWYVTLPTISPVIMFSIVIAMIQGLQYFDQAFVASTVAPPGAAGGAGDSSVTLGYPDGSTLFYPLLLYQQGFRYFNMGYAAALSMLLLVVSLAVTLLVVRNSNRWVHAAGDPMTPAKPACSSAPHSSRTSSCGAASRAPCAASGG